MIKYVMMDKEHTLPGCLHDGPVLKREIQILPSAENDYGVPQGTVNRFLGALCETYKSCGVLALDDDMVVGQLRFSPKYLFDKLNFFCLQTKESIAKVASFDIQNLVAFDELNPKSLFVNCYEVDSAYREQGIAGYMLRTLLKWAKKNGWESVQAEAIQNIKPLLYCTGKWGVDSYMKMGFEVTGHHLSDDLLAGIVNMRNGKQGDETKAQWEGYDYMSDEEAASVYEVVFNL